MTKLYKRRPIRVRAEQFIPESLPWPEGVSVAGQYFMYRGDPEEETVICPGDWIVEVEKKHPLRSQWEVVAKRMSREEFERFYEPEKRTPASTRPEPWPGREGRGEKRAGLERLRDRDLALVAAALHSCIDHWIAVEGSQTAAEHYLQLAHDVVYEEGIRRCKSYGFERDRDLMEEAIKAISLWSH